MGHSQECHPACTIVEEPYCTVRQVPPVRLYIVYLYSTQVQQYKEYCTVRQAQPIRLYSVHLYSTQVKQYSEKPYCTVRQVLPIRLYIVHLYLAQVKQYSEKPTAPLGRYCTARQIVQCPHVLNTGQIVQ